MKECNENILKVLDLAREMIVVSDKGGADSEDDSCIMLYGVIRDSAYKIRQLAENEKESHKSNGTWE
jgi:hypothetical protein